MPNDKTDHISPPKILSNPPAPKLAAVRIGGFGDSSKESKPAQTSAAPQSAATYTGNSAGSAKESKPAKAPNPPTPAASSQLSPPRAPQAAAGMKEGAGQGSQKKEQSSTMTITGELKIVEDSGHLTATTMG